MNPKLERFLYYVCAVLGLLAAIYMGSTDIKSYGFKQFERGAHTQALHHKYFGDYGTYYFLEKAFLSKDTPQDSIDISKFREAR